MTNDDPIRRSASMLLLASLLAACGGDESSEPEPGPDPTAAFTPDAAMAGPRLWIEAQWDGGGTSLTLYGGELGDVFGWSTHLRFDPALLAIESGDVALEALGATQEVAPLAVARPADLVLAATRRDPAQDGAFIDEPTVLATARLTDLQPGSGRLELTGVVVRRVDGSYVPTIALGGSLDTTGGAP